MRKFILVLFLLLVGCTKEVTEVKEPYIIFHNDYFEIDYGRKDIDYLSNEFIKESYGTVWLVSPTSTLSQNPGEHEIIYRVKNEETEQEVKYTITIHVSENPIPYFDEYPEATLSYICENWISDKVDSRIIQLMTEYEREELNDLELTLAPTKDFRLTPKSYDGYPLPTVMGTFELVDTNAYYFSVTPPVCVQLGPDGVTCTVNDEEEAITGYFYHDGNIIYYLGENNNFENYQNYPMCKFDWYY